VAERNGEIVGMAQWRLIHDRGSGIVVALVARLCAQASAAGAEFLHGGGGDGPSRLYERVAIGQASRDCHLSGKAFQVFANLDGLPAREIVRRRPPKEFDLQPAEREARRSECSR